MQYPDDYINKITEPVFKINELSMPAFRAINIKGFSGVAIFEENSPIYKGTYYFVDTISTQSPNSEETP